MPDFHALGRDVAATADSVLDNDAARAIKQLWVWAGFDKDEFPDHLWTVSLEADEKGFTVKAKVKEKNAYAPEVVPSPPASAAELHRSGIDGPGPVDVPAPEAVPPAPEPAAVPEVATDAAPSE